MSSKAPAKHQNSTSVAGNIGNIPGQEIAQVLQQIWTRQGQANIADTLLGYLKTVAILARRQAEEELLCPSLDFKIFEMHFRIG